MSGSSTSASRRVSDLAAALAVVSSIAGPVTAQAPVPGPVENVPPIGIAILDQDALFLDSEFGRRIQRDLERDRAALAAENRRIETALIEEERALTEQRGTIPPEEFAALAAGFDEKVQRIREEQDRKAQRLQEELDRARQRFLSVVGPVLTDILQRRGAAVLIDDQAVLISVPGVDITQEAIAAVDAELGDGSEEGLAVPRVRPDADADADAEPGPVGPSVGADE